MVNEKVKYYTPLLDELYFGFIVEIFLSKKGWVEKRMSPIDLNNFILMNMEKYEKSIRVKYLDKSDIESLGWKFTGRSVDDWFEIGGYFDMGSWTCYKMVAHYGYRENRLFVNAWDTGVEGSNVFEGVIKNISELKKLMQQLNIEI